MDSRRRENDANLRAVIGRLRQIGLTITDSELDKMSNEHCFF